MGLAAVALAARLTASRNYSVRVACVGLRRRGNSHIGGLNALPNVEVVALCDVWERMYTWNGGTEAAARFTRPCRAGFAVPRCV